MSNTLKRFIGVSYVAVALVLSAYSSIRAHHLAEAAERNGQLVDKVDETTSSYQRVPGLERGTGQSGQSGQAGQSGQTGRSGRTGTQAASPTLTPSQASIMIQRDQLRTFQPNCLIVWTAAWCPACKQVDALVASLRRQGYAIYILDLDENKALARDMQVRGLPTLIVWENRSEVARHRGSVSEDTIKENLKHNKPPEYEVY